jgi:hypothetical protein
MGTPNILTNKPKASQAGQPAASTTTTGGGRALNRLRVKGIDLIKPSDGPTSEYFVLLAGQKGVSKTCSLATIPQPNDGRSVYLSFDKVTHSSLIDFFGGKANVLKDRNIEVYEVTRKQGNYPGLDLSQPHTAEAVKDMVEGLLEQFRADEDVDNIFLDHFETAFTVIGKSLVHNKAKAEWGDALTGQFDAWNLRAAFIARSMAKAESAAKHCTVMTGYDEEPRWEEQTYYNSQGKEKTKKVRVFQTARWMKECRKDVFYTLFTYRVESKDKGAGPDDRAKYRYMCEVRDTRNSRLFPLGAHVDITRTADSEGGLGVFWKRAEEMNSAMGDDQ